MRVFRLYFFVLLVLGASLVSAQDWLKPYEEGLQHANRGDWATARESFLKAASFRGDQSNPTNLPGPPTERRQWRNGSPYSPSFLAAYSSYRLGLEATEDDAKQAHLTTAVKEWEALIEKGQRSSEAFYYLSNAYGRLGDSERQIELQRRFAEWGPVSWRVDTQPLPAEDLAQMQTQPGTQAQTTGTRTVTVSAGAEGDPVVAMPGAVPYLADKFALVIGNETPDLPFAAHDADRVKNALITSAGYLDSQVVVLQNASADQIRSAASELAERMPEEATILLYYTGGSSIEGGRDSVGGVPKTDLYMPFVRKAARVFAFYQVPRTMNEDSYFGEERPTMGAVAQMQATLPGGSLERTVRDGKETGVFTEAFTQVLADLRSNRIPVLEFGWQLFYKMRRGVTGTTGGGSSQTPTLPVLTNMAADARF